MSPIVLIVALVFGLVAAAYYARALQQQPSFAPLYRDGTNARHSFDALARLKSMTHEARRDYVLSLAYSIVFIACIGVLAYREGSRVVFVIIAGIVALGFALMVIRWMRLRKSA